MKNIFLLAILTFTLSSCNLYKRFERPEVKVVDSLYRDNVELTDSSSLAQLSWKELFGDQKLQNLIDSGLLYNTNLQIARLKINEAQAALQSARLAYLPSFNFAPQGNLSQNGLGISSQTYNLAVSASWELDVFGKLTNAKLGSKAALEQSLAYEQAVQTQMVATIANSYYSLLMLDRQFEITSTTAKNWNENVRVMRALKQAGRTTETAVSQAQASKIAVEASLLTIQKQIYELENSLSSLLGRASNKIDRGVLAGQIFPQEMAVGVPLQLLSNRPDIRQSEQALAQAFYATNQARAAFYPSITLSGSAGWANSVGGAIANPGTWLLSAVGSLVQPLFNKGLNTAKLKIAKAQQEQALLSFRQKLLDAGNEVNSALMQWQIARARLELDQKQIDALRNAVAGSKLLMQHSDANYLEVLTAQQTLLQAELTEVSDKFNEIQGVINLYRSLGGGVR